MQPELKVSRRELGRDASSALLAVEFNITRLADEFGHRRFRKVLTLEAGCSRMGPASA